MKAELRRRGAIIALLLLSSACASSGPTSPSGTSQPAALPSPTPSPSPPPAPVTTLPPLSGPSRSFVFDRELLFRVADYTRNSRFILYDNGAFALHSVTLADFKYHGRYTEANGVVTFDFGGAPDGAKGTLQGN